MGFAAVAGAVVEDLVRGAAEEGNTPEVGSWAWRKITAGGKKRERKQTG